MKKKSKGNVLVVDDEIRLLSTLSSILKDNGYNVFTAETGQEAQKALSDSPVDAVILDLMLPDTNGIELLKRIHREKPLLPVIMLTGHGTITRAVKATKLGAYDFFEKPVESKKILITLENALKSSRLEKERTYLVQDALERYQMVGISSKMKNLFETIEKVADTDSRILITGDSGTGKELVARAIHLQSERVGNPLITVNCSAIPEDLLESELFGHEKGSFTGALRQQKGKFELASSGTLFLDEIGELGLRIQPKILRAIENGEIQRLGGNDYIKVDVRIIAATNCDLKSAVQRKEFRDDLFYRLSVINIHIPPLRERKEDIPLLADYFLNKLCRTRKRPPIQLTPAAIEKLVEYPWPGNVRELRNLMEKIAVLSGSELVSEEEIEMYLEENNIMQNSKENNPEGGAEQETLSQILKKKEKEAIEAKLLASGWNYEKAAEELGISRSTLFSKIKEHGINRNKS
ncbi:MAG: response regulator [Candidatus Aminicenantes bacterium]|nr:response regulator [Candidatus Aminicenantes bacterium]NIM79920.1 response regulator [Candidatus Aminicenantes bacterium]NIN19259.1 response regulator [Candidatus Aminicenantes bacterium]NIN43162.1 response regulator [Candidatus Aminicenantes bacterium]NIN85901.1 response regulator [Candidatus Aminicenantes bacterium]